ncbi:hypothetical protein JL39_19785 [Rhizobium sp. YS-1r]|nr:hypothetical protein JL39_19785 [Rhizobium sp. YS-1r]
MGSYGNSAVVPSGKTFIFQRHVAHLKPQHELVDSTYLAQMLETPAVRRQADKLARGVAQKTVTLSSLRDFEIPLPPLDEQKRIAAILNKADALRAKRRQAIVLLDSLTQSIFLEMFGDPVSNPKGWEVKSLAEFELFLTSGSRGWAEYYSEQGTPFIRIQNLKGGRLSTEDLVFVNAPENAEARRTRVESGDVLISITADLGRVAVVPAHVHQAANINQHIALFRPKGINPIFLSSYLASQGGKRQFAALNRQGVKAGLNFSNIRALKILNPPMEMQRKFEKLAKLVADREIGLSGSSVGTEALFTSLQHRAFSGQL